jgi:inhibitor of cysteine peptidase
MTLVKAIIEKKVLRCEMKIKQFPIWMEITAVFMLIMVLATSGCSQKDNANVVEIDESDNKGTINLAVGDELTLTLESNPTTGYSWQLGELNSSVLAQQGEVEFISDAAEEEVVGAGGVEIFRFTAEGPGTVILNLEYLRPWEEGVAPIEVFSVEVVVE